MQPFLQLSNNEVCNQLPLIDLIKIALATQSLSTPSFLSIPQLGAPISVVYCNSAYKLPNMEKVLYQNSKQVDC